MNCKYNAFIYGKGYIADKNYFLISGFGVVNTVNIIDIHTPLGINDVIELKGGLKK